MGMSFLRVPNKWFPFKSEPKRGPPKTDTPQTVLVRLVGMWLHDSRLLVPLKETKTEMFYSGHSLIPCLSQRQVLGGCAT